MTTVKKKLGITRVKGKYLHVSAVFGQHAVAPRGKEKPVRVKKEKPTGQPLAPGTVVTLLLAYPNVTGNGTTEHGGGAHRTSPRALAYRAGVRRSCSLAGLGGSGAIPIAGPLWVNLTLCPPDKRARDIDNLCKVVFDALTLANFWVDDSNHHMRKLTVTWLPPLPKGAISIEVGRWIP